MQGKGQMLQQAATAIGAGTPFSLVGCFASLAVQVSGTFVGTVNFEVSLNGVDWVPASGAVQSTTTTGIFYFNINGIQWFRANITAYTSGSITAYGNALEESLGDGGTTVLSGRKATQIQTQNAVSLTTGAASTPASFIDCNGYDQISVTFLNDAATTSVIDIYWSNDNVSIHGIDNILTSSTTRYRVARTGIKARYAKIIVTNTDAATHTMSAWAYLIS